MRALVNALTAIVLLVTDSHRANAYENANASTAFQPADYDISLLISVIDSTITTIFEGETSSTGLSNAPLSDIFPLFQQDMRGFESTLPIQDIEYSSDAKPDSPNASSTTLPVVNSAGPDDTGNYNPENIDRSEGTVLDSSMGIKGLQAKEENAEMRYAYPASQGFRSSALSEASVTNGYADGYIPQASPLYAETGFNNNRFAQTLSKTQSAALGLSAAPASSQQVDDTPSPTSSQPRVMSVNIVLPTIAVQITEDSSKTGLTAVVPIEPVVAVPTANQKPANIDPQAIPAVSSTVTVYKTLTPSSSTDAQTLASSRRSFKQQIIDDALKSLSKIATEKGVGRLATATADTQPTIYGEKINFVESIITRPLGEHARMTTKQGHQITIDDYELAGILRMTNLASLAVKLLGPAGAAAMATMQPSPLPPLPPQTPSPAVGPVGLPSVAGPVFTVPPMRSLPQASPQPPSPPLASLQPPSPPPMPQPPQPLPQPWAQPSSGHRGLSLPSQLPSFATPTPRIEPSNKPSPMVTQPPPVIKTISLSVSQSIPIMMSPPSLPVQPLPLPLPMPQISNTIGSAPTQMPVSIESPIPISIIAVPSVSMPMSSSPFGIMPAASIIPIASSISIMSENSQPFKLQDSNAQKFTPIIPFISDGTRQATPTNSAVLGKVSKDDINANGIASILENVFHIPPGAISIDGKPVGSGGSASKDGSNDDDDNGDDGESDNEDDADTTNVVMDNQAPPEDLEAELRSRLGVERNRHKNTSSKIYAHVQIVHKHPKSASRRSNQPYSRHRGYKQRVVASISTLNDSEASLPTDVVILNNESTQNTVYPAELQNIATKFQRAALDTTSSKHSIGDASNMSTVDGNEVDMDADTDVELDGSDDSEDVSS